MGLLRSTGPWVSGSHSCTPHEASAAAMWVSWSPWKARSYSPITTASKGRSGLVRAASSAAALGRSVQGRRREQPTSKYSTTIRPTPADSLASRRDVQPPGQRAGVVDARGTAHVDHLAGVAHPVQRWFGSPCDERIGPR